MNSLVSRAVVFFSTLLVASSVFASDGADYSSAAGYKFLAIGLGLGIAVLGGTLAQGRAAAAAFEGIARNPGSANAVFTPFLLGLALMESLVILAWVGLLFLMK